MSRRITLQPHLTTEELFHRYRACRRPNEKARWRALYLISRGTLASEAARRVGRTSGWVTQLTQRYNERGVEAVPDQQSEARPGPPPSVDDAVAAELAAALRAEAPDGGLWTAPKVAAGSSSAPAAQCMRRPPGEPCAGSASRSRCRARATPARRASASRRGLKKAEGDGRGAPALAPRGGGRGLGRGRSPARAQACPAPCLGTAG
jgi:hypothetical protein